MALPSTAPPTLLVVDDEPDNFDVIEAMLSVQGYILHYVSNGQAALDCLNTVQPDLILLDVMMPGLDGMAVCRQIKALPQERGVPIIMVTALDSKQDLSRCLEAGADDFLSKPINRVELVARVRSMLRIRQQYQQLASFNAELESLVQQRTAQLQVMIDTDALTQLPSRPQLLQATSMALQSADRSKEGAITAPMPDHGVALAHLDCDHFKLVNGAFGYDVGNDLLKAIAQRLQQLLRPGDVLARMGGDEFCFLLHHLDHPALLESWTQAVFESFAKPFRVANCDFFMSVCMGVALADTATAQPETLLQAADTAMHRAKQQGKGSYQVFDAQLTTATRHRLALETDLQRALEHQEFVTYYQPIIRSATGQIVGFEALVRWQHPERHLVPPGEFIPCMEETGLVVQVGLVVLRQACEQLRIWHQQGAPDLTVSVNLSVRQFDSPTLVADIDQMLAATGVNPACLKLEVTESALMNDAEAAIAVMEQLRSRQIQISLDDFGTGYSSLAYLHRFPIDTLKIDRSFVQQIHTGNRSHQVINTIIALSSQLSLSVIAEGIETPEQLQFLQALGCEFCQGYLFDKPQPASEILLKRPPSRADLAASLLEAPTVPT
ncbi:EAL domain-containing protein [Nodosilinea sp. E11]|uniref:two-component system response regulator n=1 Tax=Nodosilinea sp. E11 TaxID=3037479 RepID=UPI002934D492|nr:EAL domain-containing protein [Nodosilinea sp. E11]WOD36969.1 EAL domain-containing protein [Nodosilinea sp. E11]